MNFLKFTVLKLKILKLYFRHFYKLGTPHSPPLDIFINNTDCYFNPISERKTETVLDYFKGNTS